MKKAISESRAPLKGYIYAVVAASLYALISVLGKLVLHEGVNPMTLIFYQYAVSSGVLYISLRLLRPALLKVSRVQLKQLGFQGVLGAFATNVCFFFALQYLNAGITSMLLFTNPVFVTLFFALTGIKVLKSANYIALALAMGGSVLVLDVLNVETAALPLAGILLGFGSALAYAFYNVYADMRMTAMSPFTVIFYTGIYGFIASGATVMITQGSIPEISLTVFVYIALISLVAGILPVIFFYKSIALIGSERTSIVATLELPFTLLVAFMILGEHLNIYQGIGVFLILAAAVFLHWGDREHRKQMDASA